MDPIETKDQDVIKVRKKVEDIVTQTDPDASIMISVWSQENTVLI